MFEIWIRLVADLGFDVIQFAKLYFTFIIFFYKYIFTLVKIEQIFWKINKISLKPNLISKYLRTLKNLTNQKFVKNAQNL
jgi:hypothetical protein